MERRLLQYFSNLLDIGILMSQEHSYFSEVEAESSNYFDRRTQSSALRRTSTFVRYETSIKYSNVSIVSCVLDLSFLTYKIVEI